MRSRRFDDYDQLRRLLLDSAAAGVPVRARGTRKAMGDIGRTDGVTIDMRASARAVDVSSLRYQGREEPTVRVEAGATVCDVLRRLEPAGRTLPMVPGWDALSLVGCTLTGSHGTGIRRGPLCEYVLVVEAMLLDPRHGLRHLAVVRPGVDPASVALAPGMQAVEDPELFDALVVGAWWLGVVVAMTYRTCADHLLEEDRRFMPWPEAKARIFPLLADESVEGIIVWICPYRHRGSRQAAIATYRRHPGPVQGKRSFGSRYGGSLLLRNASEWLIRMPHRFRPAILHHALGTTRMRGPAVLPSHEALSFGSPNRIPVVASEVAVEVGRTVELTDRLLEHYEALREEDRYVSSPIGLRFTAASQAMLAPQHGRASCMIEQVLVRTNREIHEVHESFQRFMRQQADARPHWGQYLAHPPARLLSLYPRARAFLRQLARYNGHGLFGRELHALLPEPAQETVAA